MVCKLSSCWKLRRTVSKLREYMQSIIRRDRLATIGVAGIQ
jgi:hypothetical protein